MDQILPHHCDPVLYEACMRDARGYVQLATAANGPLPAERPAAYPWGVALRDMQVGPVALQRFGCRARLQYAAGIRH